MKYSFGVPAWLGALKVSFVVFGIPALFTVLVMLGLSRWLPLSRGASAAVFAAIYLLSIVVLFFILVVLSTKTAKKK